MADNFLFTPGSGATGAADDVGGVLHPRVKVGHGVDGSYVDASAINPFPVVVSNAGSEVPELGADEYETVAASQTAQVLGPTGAAGDYLAGLLVVPATTSPGAVTILDNATSITVFAGGAGSVSNLVPFFIPIGATSVSGAWKVTTGASVSVLATGSFT